MNRLDILREARSNMERAIRKLKDLPDHLSRGMRAKVIRGRKVPIGTTGTLEGWGESQYGDWVRLNIAGETVFMARHNVTFPSRDRDYEEAVAEANYSQDVYRDMLRDAVTFSGLNLSAPLAKCDYRQNAYDDTSISDYAVNAACSDELLQFLIGELDPAQSSWGMLRWSGGSSLVERVSPTVARIQSVVRLCD